MKTPEERAKLIVRRGWSTVDDSDWDAIEKEIAAAIRAALDVDRERFEFLVDPNKHPKKCRSCLEGLGETLAILRGHWKRGSV